MCSYAIKKRATRVKMIQVHDIPEKNMTLPLLAVAWQLAGYLKLTTDIDTRTTESGTNLCYHCIESLQ